jgi:cytochrome P450
MWCNLSIYMRRLIAQRRRHPGDDVLSQLLRAEYNGTRLDQIELVTTTILLLIAGHETTVNLLGNGLLALLQAPAQLARLRAQPGLISSGGRGAVALRQSGAVGESLCPRGYAVRRRGNRQRHTHPTRARSG